MLSFHSSHLLFGKAPYSHYGIPCGRVEASPQAEAGTGADFRLEAVRDSQLPLVATQQLTNAFQVRHISLFVYRVDYFEDGFEIVADVSSE